MNKQLIAPARVVRDYLSNSMVWEDFLAQGGFIEGDIVVADPFKAGTTWTQRIIQQILHNGQEKDGGLSDTSPWLDSSWGNHAEMLKVLKEQRKAGKRRVMKSHLPADALPITPEPRYVYVGRNGKDLGISFHNYLKHFSGRTMSTINRIHAEWSGNSVPLVIPEERARPRVLAPVDHPGDLTTPPVSSQAVQLLPAAIDPGTRRSATSEEGHRGQHPTMNVVGVGKLKFGQHAADVLFHGALGDP